MDPLVAVSALEHYSYCPRQCGLIHLEGCFIENEWTARGSLVHERVDQAAPWRGGQTLRALTIFSDRLGLVGRADAIVLSATDPPYPVEYKSGPLRSWAHEAIQLCAQALCLEEMFGRAISEGAIYYAASRRQRRVRFTPALRDQTMETIRKVRDMVEKGRTPQAVWDPRCRHCSLQPACLPDVLNRPRRLSRHEGALRALDV